MTAIWPALGPFSSPGTNERRGVAGGEIGRDQRTRRNRVTLVTLANPLSPLSYLTTQHVAPAATNQQGDAQ